VLWLLKFIINYFNMKKYLISALVVTTIFSGAFLVIPSSVLASRTITSAKLNGTNSITVKGGASITAAVTVQVTNNSYDWTHTRYKIENGSWNCVDTPDHSKGDPNTETFQITAPSNIGVYDVNFEAHSGSGCNDENHGSFLLTDGITVDNTAPTFSFTDNVAVGPIKLDTIAINFGDASVKKYGYVVASVDCKTSANTSGFSTYNGSFDVNNQSNNGKFICAYGEDAAGNKAALASSNALNIDVTLPTLHLPANIATDATGSSGAVVNYTATADDANPTHPAVTCAPVSGSTFPIGTTAISCSATDTAGNTATGNFNVTVNAVVIPPTDVCPNLDGPQAEVPSGYSLVGGQCVVTPLVCGTGFYILNNECVAEPVCSETQHLDNHVCAANVLPPVDPTCTDGIQNQDETGVDSGGVCAQGGGSEGQTGDDTSGSASSNDAPAAPVTGGGGHHGGHRHPIGGGEVLGASTSIYGDSSSGSDLHRRLLSLMTQYINLLQTYHNSQH
jgi:hypothetical protein